MFFLTNHTTKFSQKKKKIFGEHLEEPHIDHATDQSCAEMTDVSRYLSQLMLQTKSTSKHNSEIQTRSTNKQSSMLKITE